MKRTAIFVIATAGILLTFAVFISKTSLADSSSADVRLGQDRHTTATAAPSAFDKAPAVGTKAECPVTGEEFTVTKETKSSVYKGKYYVFCCPACKPQFDANPDKYIK